MKATIRIPREVAERISNEWAEEHEGYYGQPFGCRSLDLRASPYGWPQCADRDWSPSEPGQHVRCGFSRGEDGTCAWVRSSGTWASIRVDGDEAVMTVAGRRHSVAELLWDIPEHAISYEIIESQMPHLAPWETSDWKAFRYPTAEEIDAGRGEDDMVRVACAATASEAADLLRAAVPAPPGTCIGQVQHGADGAVEIVEAR